MTSETTRITVERGKRGGTPCGRGLRITVWDVLGWLGSGITEEQILDEHPDLEKADFPAVYHYASEAGRNVNLRLRLLLDENLSPRLIPRLLSLFPRLTHVRNVGLQRANDRQIWDWAKINGYMIVTTDSDCVALSYKCGWPPKVSHIERCDYPFRIIET